MSLCTDGRVFYLAVRIAIPERHMLRTVTLMGLWWAA